MSNAAVDLLMHPVRIRIVVAVFDRQLTTQQIAASIPDVPQATLYRHINKLAAAGVLQAVEERQVRGTVEKVYATVRDTASLGPSAGEMSIGDWSHAFSAFTAFLAGQFGLYINSPNAHPVADGVSFRTVPLHLSDDEFAAFKTDLGALVRPLLDNVPSPDRRRRQISTIVIPDPQSAPEEKPQ